MENYESEQPWFKLESDEVFKKLESNEEGISEKEADSRREGIGANVLQEEKKVSPLAIALRQFKSPLIYVLIVAFIITALLDRWTDASVIAAVLIINGVIGFFQEFRAESAIKALMGVIAAKTTVIREGEEKEVNGKEIVPGDVVRLTEGDVVPADVRLFQVKSLQINEASLTGESVPVAKTKERMETEEADLSPSDKENMAFMGTAVTSGSATGVVVATAEDSEIGNIASAMRESEKAKNPLQERIGSLAKWIAFLITLIAFVAFVIGIAMGESAEEMFLMAAALAVSAMPAGLPIVVTVALAVGVKRMAKQNALIRHLPAVETLGSTTVIVSDKTGTLTQNKMTVKQIKTADKVFYVGGPAMKPRGEIKLEKEKVEIKEGGPLYFTLLAGLLNNEARLEKEGKKNKVAGKGDPMDVAMLISGEKGGLKRSKLKERFPKKDEVPFKTENKFSATIHEDKEGGKEKDLVLIKGAPETIIEMCQSALSEDGSTKDIDKEDFKNQSDTLAGEGLRVLAMAIGTGDEAVKSIKSDTPEGMIFVGMQGLLDPPRTEATKAVDNCHKSGIRVIMITGDHAKTAAAIAEKTHVDRNPKLAGKSQGKNRKFTDVFTGKELRNKSKEEITEALERSNIFARSKPKQKMEIIKSLKEQGEIIAVTGDGVNDAPALKAAHLGVAMGETGTEVAKEASDMIITDDNFASVYDAVKEGRTAFRNIRMATFFLLSTGLAEVIAILTTLGFRWPLPFIPAQILWLNVVTNSFADVALAFEPGVKELYEKKPRDPNEGILNWPLVERTIIVGVWFAIATLGVFYWKKDFTEESLGTARVTALTTLVFLQKFHVFNSRSENVSIFKINFFANKWMMLAFVTMFIHVGALYLPWTQATFQFEPLNLFTWGVIIALGATAILVNEWHKWICKKSGSLTEGKWFFKLAGFKRKRKERREKRGLIA